MDQFERWVKKKLQKKVLRKRDNEGTKKKKYIWRRFARQKAAGDGMIVWMTLQSSHMPDRCHVW